MHLGIKKASRSLEAFVLGTGLEPVRTNVHWILSPTCLPIPPPELGLSIKNPIVKWSITLSERRDLNPRPSPWQGDALPLSYFRLLQQTLLSNADANLQDFFNLQSIFFKKMKSLNSLYF